jgi:DNA invertase Pin-like site-specific DNA recombinase
MANGRFVAYHRVSTARQGASGLGLEAQQEAVRRYLNGGAWQLVGELVEVETATRKKQRPKIAEALRLCRLHNATLIIAKLDRLARNVYFVSGLMEAGVDFVALDMPQANRLTIHIMAAMAEHEAEAISLRTKDALAAAKARGAKLGGDRGNFAEVRSLGPVASRKVRAGRAAKRAADVLPAILDIKTSGASLRGIAAELTARGIPAPRGGAWSAIQVSRIVARQAA